MADTGGLSGGGPDTTGPPVPAQVRVIANRAGTFYGQHMKAGYIYTIGGGGTSLADGVAATDASLRAAAAVAVDHAGNVLVARAAWWDVRMLAEKTGSYYGKNVKAGHVYAIAGNGRLRYSGDGGPAASAELQPSAVATLRSGDMTAVADANAGAVRVVPARTSVFFGRLMRAGFIYTVARTGLPVAVAFDPAGNLLIAARSDHLVRVVAWTSGTFYGQRMTAGHIYTIAGGGTGQLPNGVPALTAQFEGPTAVASDLAGNVLIIDSDGYESSTRVRVVAAHGGTFYGQKMTVGDIYTVAGDGTYGQSGDGGPATAASIVSQGIAVDGSGNLVLADRDRARVVAATTGTFYGRKMTAGYIYTVAGGGRQAGNGVAALKANLGADVVDVAVDSAGNLLLGAGNTVYMVAERAGSYYGKAMRAGDVYPVAVASLSLALLGDGGPAIGALFEVIGIAVQPRTGNLLIADDLTDRVRSVSR